MGRLLNKLKVLFEPVEEARRDVLVDAEVGTITVHMPYQPSRSMHFAEIQSIGVRIASQGPLLSSLRWTVGTATGQLVIPFEGDHAEALLHVFQGFAGFDNEALGRAMLGTGTAEFRCWPAEPVPPGNGVPER